MKHVFFQVGRGGLGNVAGRRAGTRGREDARRGNQTLAIITNRPPPPVIARSTHLSYGEKNRSNTTLDAMTAHGKQKNDKEKGNDKSRYFSVAGGMVLRSAPRPEGHQGIRRSRSGNRSRRRHNFDRQRRGSGGVN